MVDWDEHYHSRYGAIQEAYHVFINPGFSTFKKASIAVLEIGFGTGLNALVTLLEAHRRKLRVEYTGVEAFPVSANEIEQLNFTRKLNILDQEENFQKMHSCSWEQPYLISDYFTLTKRKLDFKKIDEENCYDLIYFDAFGPRVQPELWTEFIMGKMFRALRLNGVLVTYSAKGSVRRAMLTVGFKVERLPGPTGKREMLRAIKMF